MSLNVIVKSEPRGVAKGQFQCLITDEGITLTQRKKQEIKIPIGTQAAYLGKNQFQVVLPGHRLEIAVTKFGSYQNRLAKDLAGFVSESGKAPVLSDYSLPWYFYLICILPIGIPIITLGGAIPAFIGFAFAGACFGIAQKEDWPTSLRVVVALALVATGYLILIALLSFAMNQRAQ